MDTRVRAGESNLCCVGLSGRLVLSKRFEESCDLNDNWEISCNHKISGRDLPL